MHHISQKPREEGAIKPTGTVQTCPVPIVSPAPERGCAAETLLGILIKERGRKEREKGKKEKKREGEKDRKRKKKKKRRREEEGMRKRGKEGRKGGEALSCSRTLTHLVVSRARKFRLNCYFLLLMDHLARTEPKKAH